MRHARLKTNLVTALLTTESPWLIDRACEDSRFDSSYYHTIIPMYPTVLTRLKNSLLKILKFHFHGRNRRLEITRKILVGLCL